MNQGDGKPRLLSYCGHGRDTKVTWKQKMVVKQEECTMKPKGKKKEEATGNIFS